MLQSLFMVKPPDTGAQAVRVLFRRRLGRMILKDRGAVEGLMSFILRHGATNPATDLPWVASHVRLYVFICSLLIGGPLLDW